MAFGYPPRGILRGTFQRLFGSPQFLRRLQWPTIVRLLDLEPRHVVLDVGCGDLQLTAELAKRDLRSVVGVDPAPRLETLGHVARRFARLRLARADGSRLPLATGSVDRVLASSVLQMIPNPATLLAECRRVLRVGGVIVVTVPEAYRYLPRVFRSDAAYAAFLRELNAMFGVQGSGYISEKELIALIEAAGFRAGARARVPGRAGTFVWEASLAASYRLRDSRLSALLSFPFYPLARLLQRDDRKGCELVMAATAA